MSLFGQKQGGGLDALLHRQRPSAWQQFLRRPCIFLSRKLYTWQRAAPVEPVANPVSIVCISDTHNTQPSLPAGDMLIHAGDLTQSGSMAELKAALSWLRSQPHASKIVIAGNHDLLLDAGHNDSTRSAAAAAERTSLDWGDIIYLDNSEVTVTCANGRSLRIYGSPYSPRHGNWAFQYPRSQDVWQVPEGIDVLVTHCPPRAHLDLLNLGCVHLLRELWRVRPRLHVFGHIHDAAGTEWLQFNPLQAAYERTIGSSGLWDLLCTAFELMRSLFGTPATSSCLLVNSCMVGGLRDDVQRQPVRVTI